VIWYTAFTFGLLNLAAKEREQAKASVATCLLSELSYLDDALRTAASNPAQIRAQQFPTPVLEHSLWRVQLFRPDTVLFLTQCLGLMEDVRVEMREIGDREARGVPTLGIRERIGELVKYPIATISPLAECLLIEGGVLPLRFGSRAGPDPLPISPFGHPL
jgi:hypothetical protein